MCIVNTPYDDVFRTLLTDCRKLIIPVVNEIFHANYTGSEQVILKENEIFLRQQNGNFTFEEHFGEIGMEEGKKIREGMIR